MMVTMVPTAFYNVGIQVMEKSVNACVIVPVWNAITPQDVEIWQVFNISKILTGKLKLQFNLTIECKFRWYSNKKKDTCIGPTSVIKE